MPHWRTLLDSEVIRFVDLQDREYTLEIAKVAKGKVTGKKGKDAAKSRGMIWFKGREKPLAAGAAIMSQIESLYGPDYTKWIGKLLTIYPDPSVTFGNDRVGGVRVRPIVPKGKATEAPMSDEEKALIAEAERNG